MHTTTHPIHTHYMPHTYTLAACPPEHYSIGVAGCLRKYKYI